MISLSKFFASGGEIREWKTGFRYCTGTDREIHYKVSLALKSK
jgi:hypothetical protein